MTPEQRQQALSEAREAYKWLKYHLVHTPQEPLQKPISCLLEGFEILDAEADAEQPDCAHPSRVEGGGAPRSAR